MKLLALLCLLIPANAQRLQCEIERTCWVDAAGYLHKERPPGCPTPNDTRACAAYKQSLAWQGEAQSYPATSKESLQVQIAPHLDGVTLPKLSRFQRLKRWLRDTK